MENGIGRRVISLLLAAVMTVGLVALDARADENEIEAGDGGQEQLAFQQSDIVPDMSMTGPGAGESPEDAEPAMVRVSIILEDEPALASVDYDAEAAGNDSAVEDLREDLLEKQKAVIERVEKEALDGEPLDVVWNLTLAANIISANVMSDKLDAIREVKGVAEVVEEALYTPEDTLISGSAEPNMKSSSAQIGAGAAWAAGFTGAGSRIAVIDTGTDDNHQSFDDGAFQYSLGVLAEKAGEEEDAFIDSLGLLDKEEIAEKLPKLNIASNGVTADRLYKTSKLPFAYNYVDESYVTNHDSDNQSEHGSHVAGIAAANAYIPVAGGGETYKPALDSVYVQGVAPDAQIVTMKVFGSSGGAYDSDYMAAIEDAIVLECDAVNLSLGSTYGGFSRSPAYSDILNKLVNSGMVTVISSGNSGNWASDNKTGSGLLYGDDVNMQTGGSPGTFTNALTVASVDNDGATGTYIKLDEKLVFYSESNYSNTALTGIAGDHKFVYIDSTGTKEEFTALAGEINGNIAVCNRGGIYFSEKANNAVEAGAVGVIIVNTENGTTGMDLSEYVHSQPVVCISLSDGALFKGEEKQVQVGDSQVSYYTGSLTIGKEIVSDTFNSEYYTMSSFSSWGVPGSLELKPEITAPGGSIYSVDGSDLTGTGYETMSGTSMAAPQVTGMTAVLSQYIKSKGLDEATGLNRRTLAQSLLMSTAVPVREDHGAHGVDYASVMQQGAGLANIGNAINAQSYILMGEDATDSWADGKVKAELGDDPGRDGTYSFGFTVGDLNGVEKSFTLSAGLFTQDLTESDGVTWLDTYTTPLAANVTYTVNGQSFVPRSAIEADVNVDGVTDSLDAQAILDLITGKIDGAGLDLEAADADGDGARTSRDAHLILANMETAAFTVPAGGKADVKVNITLTDDLSEYVNGAYIEGYVNVNPVASAEGALDVVHSIPVLGFFGNWTDASMFDRNGYVSSKYGDDTVPYTIDAVEEGDGTVYMTNYLSYVHQDEGSKKNQIKYQVGNPYAVEETYPADRAAIGSNDILYDINATLIRNAGAVVTVITDSEDNILYMSPVTTQTIGAYYNTSSTAWTRVAQSYRIGRRVSTLGVEEGDTIKVSLVAIPEYYEEDGALTTEQVKALLSSKALGGGAFLTTQLRVDDSAPTLVEAPVKDDEGNITVKVRDNQYVANLAVLSKSGVKVYDSVVPRQTGEGEEFTYTFPVADAGIGSKCMIAVSDYAGNTRSYILDYGGEDEDIAGGLFAYANDYSSLKNEAKTLAANWISIDPENLSTPTTGTGIKGMDVFSPVAGDGVVSAAAYVDGYVFYVVGTTLYVSEIQDMSESTMVADLKASGISDVTDMAYNPADGQLYAVDSDASNPVWCINPLNGHAEKRFTVTSEITNPTTKNLVFLAIDDEGTFYGATVGTGATSESVVSHLVTWKAEKAEDGGDVNVTSKALFNSDKKTSPYGYSGSMTWDPVSKNLYMAGSGVKNGMPYMNNRLYKFSTDGESAGLANLSGGTNDSRLYLKVTGLFVVGGDAKFNPDGKDEPQSIKLSETSLDMFVTGTETLICELSPWTLTDRSVKWASSDEKVVTVNNGLVTAVGTGQAKITVTATAKEDLTAECEVTVSAIPDIQMSALIVENDKAHWASYSTSNTEGWESMADAGAGYIAGTLYGSTVYVHDGNKLWAVDADTFAARELGAFDTEWFWADGAPAPTQAKTGAGSVFAIASGGTRFELIDPENARIPFAIDNLAYLFQTDPVAAIAYYDTTEYSPSLSPFGYKTEADNYYFITEGGELWSILLYTQEIGTTNITNPVSLGYLEGVNLTGVSAVGSGSTASLYYDETSKYLVLTSGAPGGEAVMQLIDPVKVKVVATTGFGSDVTSVTSNYRFDRSTTLTVRLNRESMDLYEGLTGKLEATVVLYESNSGVTWKTDNDQVATVDQNGVVTAKGEGTAHITAESVELGEDNQHATASCEVNVTGKLRPDTDAAVGAQVISEDGTARWVRVPLKDPDEAVDITDAAVVLTAGGKHGDKVYGTNVRLNDATGGNWFAFGVADDEYLENIGGKVGSSFAPIDMTTAPEITVDGLQAFGMPIYISNNNVMFQGKRCLFLLEDYDTFDHTDSRVTVKMDIEELCPGAAAIAFAGAEETAENFYILSADGTLYTCAVKATVTDGAVSYNIEKLDGEWNTGLTIEDDTLLSMESVDTDNDGKPDGIVVADGGNGRADLFYLDVEKKESAYLGTVSNAVGISAVHVIEGEVKTAPGSVAADRAEGTLNAVSEVPGASESEETTGAPTLTGTTGGGTANVTLHVAASENGLVTITYDKYDLTYQEAVCDGVILSSVVADPENGKLTIAYASKDPYTGDAVQVTFSYTSGESAIITAVTASFAEENENRYDGDGPELEAELTIPRAASSASSVVTENTTENGETATETTAAPHAAVKDGKATATVSGATGEEIVRQAEENKSDTIVVAPKMPDDVTSAKVTLHGDTVSDIAGKTNADLRIETPISDVTIPNGALAELGEAGSLEISAEKAGDTVKLQISAGGRAVDKVPGGIKAAVALKDGEVAVVVDEDGNETIIPKSIVEDGVTYVLLDGSATISVISSAADFEDVGSGDWFEDAVGFVSSHKLFNGTGAAAFEPETDMSRAMLATVLWRLESEAGSAGNTSFLDVEDGAWYAEGVAWAGETGVIMGSGQGVFEPTRSVTRQEMAVMLYRYAGNLGLDIARRGSLESFIDFAGVDNWAADAMSWAVSVGLLRGDESGALDPTAGATRSEVAVVLQRFITFMVK